MSFTGSIPLGHLNIVGFAIYSKVRIENLLSNPEGVIFVEEFVIYFTLIFAGRLVSNVKLMKVIDVFTVLFLGYSFYSYSNQTTISATALAEYKIHSAFLINGNYTKTEKALKFHHVAGKLMGTLARVMVFF